MDYDELKTKLREIIEIAKEAPSDLQCRVFDILVKGAGLRIDVGDTGGGKTLLAEDSGGSADILTELSRKTSISSEGIQGLYEVTSDGELRIFINALGLRDKAEQVRAIAKLLYLYGTATDPRFAGYSGAEIADYAESYGVEKIPRNNLARMISKDTDVFFPIKRKEEKLRLKQDGKEKIIAWLKAIIS